MKSISVNKPAIFKLGIKNIYADMLNINLLYTNDKKSYLRIANIQFCQALFREYLKSIFINKPAILDKRIKNI
jgi:hypothetical protein